VLVTALPGFIVDLSSNNTHPIDYAAAKAAGVIAAIIKATDGTGYTNPYFAEDAAGFEAVGVPVLAYHFAEFTDAAAEATHFVSVAGSRARVLDSETNTDVAWQNAFLAALNLPADEEMDYGSASTLPQSGIRALLWPASYGKNYGFGDCWQFTETQSVNGIHGNVDASEWIGSQADFDALFNIAAPPAPQKVGTDMAFEDPTGGIAVVRPNGGVYNFFGSQYHGSLGQINPALPPGGTNAATPAAPIVGGAYTKTGAGYWLVGSDGGIFAFGDAGFHGSSPGNPAWIKPVVGIARDDRYQNGYIIVADDGASEPELYACNEINNYAAELVVS